MLTSHVKGVKNGYPLRIIARKVDVITVEFSSHFIQRMLQKINWPALKSAAESVGHGGGVPDEIPPNCESNEDFLRAAHHVLMEVEVIEGDLECPESGRKFPIQEGIPNMLLREDEL